MASERREQQKGEASLLRAYGFQIFITGARQQRKENRALAGRACCRLTNGGHPYDTIVQNGAVSVAYDPDEPAVRSLYQ
jgi:hypothetical protein